MCCGRSTGARPWARRARPSAAASGASAGSRRMTSPRRAKPFNWNDFGLRVVSAAVLIPTVVFAVWKGDWLFLLLVAIGVALLAIEWGLMTERRAPTRIAAAVALSVLAS